MTTAEKFLIAPSDRPSWLEYPLELLELVKNGETMFIPWRLLEAEYALPECFSLRERYDRELVPFAFRQDTDDLACIERGCKNAVKIIHNHASKGWENEGEFESFSSWLDTVKKQMAEWAQCDLE